MATNVKINEILADPAAVDKEWVEIYNPDSVDLSANYLKDKTGTKKVLNTLQSCGGYQIWELTTSNGEGWLNNTGSESIFLYDQSNNLIDSFEDWSSPGQGMTLGRIPDKSGSFQETKPTKCALNVAQDQPTPTPSFQASVAPSKTLTLSKSPSPVASMHVIASVKPSASFISSGKSPEVLSENQAIQSTKDADEIYPPSEPKESEQSHHIADIFIASGAMISGISLAAYLWYKRISPWPYK